MSYRPILSALAADQPRADLAVDSVRELPVLDAQ
jgi:hypothetical protein